MLSSTLIRVKGHSQLVTRPPLTALCESAVAPSGEKRKPEMLGPPAPSFTVRAVKLWDSSVAGILLARDLELSGLIDVMLLVCPQDLVEGRREGGCSVLGGEDRVRQHEAGCDG